MEISTHIIYTKFKYIQTTAIYKYKDLEGGHTFLDKL